MATSTSTSKVFTVRREGQNLSLCFHIEDITMERLGAAFKVDETTVFLKEEFGDQTYWPTGGTFQSLRDLYDGASLLVMGNTRSMNPAAAANVASSFNSVATYDTTSTSTQAASGSMVKSQSSAQLFAAKGNWGKKNKFSCKIVYAKMTKNAGKGPPLFEEIKQTFIMLNDKSANLPNVTDMACEKFGEDVTIVAGNGLPIEDEPGTRCISFWKCGSRKLYAIVNKQLKKRQTEPDSSDDSDDKDFTPKRKKSKSSVDEIKAHISKLVTNTDDIKKEIGEIVQVSNSLKLPLSVIKLVKDTFKCKICHTSPMKPPIIASKCCNTLIACNKCINTWYEGDDIFDKSCPNCRQSRGYAHTVQFKGLDDFLLSMSEILESANSE